MNWLYRIPEPLLLALSAGLLAALSVGVPYLVQRLRFVKPNDLNTEFVTRTWAPLFTMTALVLAFTLVEADTNFRRVDAQVTTEASQLNQLDRLLVRYGSADAGKVRPLLRAYALSIVGDEWPQMLKGGSSEKTSAAFSPVSQAVLALDPEPGRETVIYTEMLKLLEAIAVSRDSRLNDVHVSLPAIYWEVIVFSVAMLLLVSGTVERTGHRALIIAAQVSVLGAFIGFAFIMDTPFLGDTAVTSDAIAHVAAVMAQRAH